MSLIPEPLAIPASSLPRSFSAVETVDEILAANHWTRLFVVTQMDAYTGTGAARRLEAILKRRSLRWFTEFSPNPKIEDAMAGIEAFRSSGAQAILAVGGGSALDMAKLVAGLAPQREEALEIILGGKDLERPAAPVIAAPTTAGTGSEATHFAVVYVNGQKFSLDDPALLPQHQIVDPTLTYNMPPALTAVTGLDAFCQAMESLWSVQSTEYSRGLAGEALGLAWEHLEEAALRPSPESRAGMCRASHLAGQAICISRTTAAHAVSYAMTSRFGLPHGHAVAMTLGPLLEFNAGISGDDCLDPRGYKHATAVTRQIVQALRCSSASEARAAIQEKMARMGCAPRLSAVGVSGAENLSYLCLQVNEERLANNPRRLTPAALKALLESIA